MGNRAVSKIDKIFTLKASPRALGVKNLQDGEWQKTLASQLHAHFELHSHNSSQHHVLPGAKLHRLPQIWLELWRPRSHLLPPAQFSLWVLSCNVGIMMAIIM